MLSGEGPLLQDARKVLAVLAERRSYWCFEPLMNETGLDRARVRRACRFLARKGFAKFRGGLWSEDGEPYGSGYAATKEGREGMRRRGE